MVQQVPALLVVQETHDHHGVQEDLLFLGLPGAQLLQVDPNKRRKDIKTSDDINWIHVDLHIRIKGIKQNFVDCIWILRFPDIIYVVN